MRRIISGLSTVALLATLTLYSSSAKADPLLSYRDFNIAYSHIDSDEGEDYDGVVTDVKYEFMQGFFAKIGYDYHGADNSDLQTLTYGGGAYFPLSKDLHLVANVGGEHHRIHVDEAGSANFDRIFAGPELRYRLLPALEVDGSFTWSDGEGSAEHDYGVGAVVALQDALALTVGVEWLDTEAVQYTTGLRYSFD